MRIENWSITSEDTPYKAPELRRPCTQGLVYGNPKFEDGTPILTSPVDKVVEKVIVTMSGSTYELGEVDPDYELNFPNEGIGCLDLWLLKMEERLDDF